MRQYLCAVCWKPYDTPGQRDKHESKCAKEGGAMDITKVGDHIYNVESESVANMTYIVHTQPGQDRTCNCTGYATKRNKNKSQGLGTEGSCKHLTAVLELEDQETSAAFESLKLKSRMQADLNELEDM